MTMRAFVTTTLGVGLLLTQAGCYQFVPLADTAPLPEAGSEVRLAFAPPQAMNLGARTVHDITLIEGEVFENGGDTLAVFSRYLRSAYGQRYIANGAVFYIPPSDTRRVEQRQFMPLKTGLAVGVAALATVAILKAAAELGGGSNPGDPDDPDEFRIAVPVPIGIRIGGH